MSQISQWDPRASHSDSDSSSGSESSLGDPRPPPASERKEKGGGAPRRKRGRPRKPRAGGDVKGKSHRYKMKEDGRIPDDLFSTRVSLPDQVVQKYAALASQLQLHAPGELRTLSDDQICKASGVIMSTYGESDPAMAFSLSVRLMRQEDGVLPVRVPECFNRTLRILVYKFISSLVHRRRKFYGRLNNSADSGKLYQVLNSLKDSRNIFYLADQDPRKPCTWRFNNPSRPERMTLLQSLLFKGEKGHADWQRVVQLYNLPDNLEPGQQLQMLLMPGKRLMGYIRAESGIFDNDDWALKAIRGKPGGKHVAFSNRHPPPTDIYLGPVAGSPPGSFAIRALKQIQAVYAYAKHAPYPEALRLAIRVLFCDTLPDKLEAYRLKKRAEPVRSRGHKMNKEMS